MPTEELTANKHSVKSQYCDESIETHLAMFDAVLGKRFEIADGNFTSGLDPNGIPFRAFTVGGPRGETHRPNGLCETAAAALQALLGQVLLWLELNAATGKLYWRIRPEVDEEVVAVIQHNYIKDRPEIMTKTMYMAYCRLSVSEPSPSQAEDSTCQQ